MKLLSVVLASLALCACERLSDGQLKEPTDTKMSKDFLARCSGMDTSDDAVLLLATANCLGRTRGFIDGHQLTIKLQQTSEKHQQLWCVDKKVTDGQLLHAVLDWSVSHRDEYDSITTKFSGLDAATAVTMRAINATFPCKDTHVKP